MQISIMLEGQMGLTWRRWRRITDAVEALGFAGLFRSDHFTNARPPEQDSLELIVSLTDLAARTRRIHFGPCVAPFSFRDPVMLARQALALDDLSDGRMILGVGAGWQEREHQMFGYRLGDVPTRVARFDEGLQVTSALLRSRGRVDFAGQFYRLNDAILLPRPRRLNGPPIMVGGNGLRRTLPLAARYAHFWNAVYLSPDDFRARSARLDELMQAEQRHPGDLRRTLMTGLYFARDEAELDRRLAFRHDRPELASLSLEDAVAAIRARSPVVIGTTDAVCAQLHAYADAGVQEIMLQWLDLDDIAGLESFAEAVLPQFIGR